MSRPETVPTSPGTSVDGAPTRCPRPPTPTSRAPPSRCRRRSPPVRRAHPLRLRPRGRAPGGRRAAGRTGPPGPGPSAYPEERLGAARRGGSRARRVGDLLRRRRRQAGRRRGRIHAGRSPSARPTTWSATPTGSWPWSSSRSGWRLTVSHRLGLRGRPRQLHQRRRQPRGLSRWTPSSTCTSRRATPCSYGASHPHVAGRARRRAGDGHPRPHRPRRHLRRGEVRPGLPAPPASGRCSASTWRSPTLRSGSPQALRRSTGTRTPVRGGAYRDRPAAAPGDLPGRRQQRRWPGRLGGGLPAGLGDPPGR